MDLLMQAGALLWSGALPLITRHHLETTRLIKVNAFWLPDSLTPPDNAKIVGAEDSLPGAVKKELVENQLCYVPCSSGDDKKQLFPGR